MSGTRKSFRTFAAAWLALALLGPVSVGYAQPPAGAGGEQATPAGTSSQANQQERDENDAYRHSAMVGKFGHMLGMSPNAASTAFEVGNFLLLAIGVGFLLAKILPKTFRDRSSAIQKHLLEARVATEQANVRLNSVEERLSKLDDQIAGMKAQAEKDAAADEARLRAAVEEEKRKILAAADGEIAAASQHAQRQLQQYAAELAIDQAAQKLVITAETDRLLVQSFARRLGMDDAKGGPN